MREATRARAVLAVLLLASLTLVLLDVRESAAVSGLRTVVSAIVGPIEKAAGGVAAPFITVGRSMTSFGDAEDRNGIAQQQLNALANNPEADAAIAAQSQQLQAMLGVAGVNGYSVVPARVVAYGLAQTFSGTVTIDVGSTDGVTSDMSVITGGGLVGKVIAVSPTTSTVQLMTDQSSVIASRVDASGEVGALEGTGQPNEITLRMLDPTAPLKEGDKISTFGSPDGKPYAPGLPLGTVTSLRGEPGQVDRIARVTPAVDLTALDIVGVILTQTRKDPRPALTPSAPTAPSAPATPDPASAAGPTPSPQAG